MTDVEKQRLILVGYLIDDVITIVEQYLNCKFFFLPDPEWEKSSSKLIECYNNKKIHWCKQMGVVLQTEKKEDEKCFLLSSYFSFFKREKKEDEKCLLFSSYFSFFKREKKGNSFLSEAMKNVKYLNLPLSKLNLLPSKLPQLLMLKIIIGKSKTSILPEFLSNCSSLQYLHLKLNESVDENFFKSLSIPSLQTFKLELSIQPKEIKFDWSDLTQFIHNHQKTLNQLELIHVPRFHCNHSIGYESMETIANLKIKSNFFDALSKSAIQHLNFNFNHNPSNFYESETKLNFGRQLLSLTSQGISICLDNQFSLVQLNIDRFVTFDLKSIENCESLDCCMSHFKKLNSNDTQTFKIQNLSVENSLNSEIVQLIQKSPKIKKLKLTTFQLNKSLIASFSNLITSLHLHRCQFNISFLSSADVIVNLTNLSVSDSLDAWTSKDYEALATIALNRPLLTEIDLKFIHQHYRPNESKKSNYYQFAKWVKIPHLKKLFFPQLTSSQTVLLMEELAENSSLLLSSLTHIGTLHFWKISESSLCKDDEEIQNFFDSAGIVYV
jgi:hypothetical protein